jgi:ketosteroid isomerase-like protein
MTRTPHEIFEHHVAALGAGDLDDLFADYAEDAVLITPQGAVRGKQAVREAFIGMLGQIPDATFDVYTRIYEGDVLLTEWTATGSTARITDGVDTLVFGDGEIRVQTVRFTVEPVA